MKTFEEFTTPKPEKQLDYSGLNIDDLADRITDFIIQYDDVQFHSNEGIINNQNILDVTNINDDLYFHTLNKTYKVDKNYDIVIGPARIILTKNNS